ncbi:alpha-glucosidase [Frigidibacter sp. ROC022]|uniref:alpha-glucosidase n=1 Tax=Frigidibacter sp. ROC022 TaxID=2971796 RepID=UPI00215AC3F5|nr:alpha-glucosidase [Frigidibacter sp. ROC022]MCR8725060.1 alpha-amylase family glycosyl hydrolase [Frigidibacter sp. ROC022]
MQDWWRGAVIYQVYPRSFQDDNGDGVGDLPGITRRLDHIAALGADAVWLSPVFTSPMADMGYDVSDYRDIDPLFGTLADFDALLDRAHALGLKVIIDQVISHSSDQHPWFVESRASRDNPKADWYVWADPGADGMPPNNWPSVFGGSAWEWEPRRRQYYLHNFLASQPDLNFHNRDVQDAMIAAMRFWLDRGVDGFRLDTVNYFFHDPELRPNPPARRDDPLPAVNPYDMQEHVYSKSRPENIAFLQRLRALTDSYADRAMVGEIGDDARRSVGIMAEYTKGDDRLHMAYSFDMLGPEFTARHFRSRIETFFDAAPDGWPCWSFSNHDVPRHVSRWAGHGTSEDAVARLAIAMLASFEGTIGLYQGEELGQTETDILYDELTDPPGFKFWPDYKGRDGCRTPMVWDGSASGGFTSGTPWLPIKPPQLARNVAAQEAANDSVLAAYRATLAFRRGSEALRRGGTRFLDLPEPVLGFHREADGQRLTCLFNLSPRPQRLRIAGAAELAGPGRASLSDGVLALPGSGHAWLQGTGPHAPEVTMA